MIKTKITIPFSDIFGSPGISSSDVLGFEVCHFQSMAISKFITKWSSGSIKIGSSYIDPVNPNPNLTLTSAQFFELYPNQEDPDNLYIPQKYCSQLTNPNSSHLVGRGFKGSSYWLITAPNQWVNTVIEPASFVLFLNTV